MTTGSISRLQAEPWAWFWEQRFSLFSKFSTSLCLLLLEACPQVHLLDLRQYLTRLKAKFTATGVKKNSKNKKNHDEETKDKA